MVIVVVLVMMVTYGCDGTVDGGDGDHVDDDGNDSLCYCHDHDDRALTISFSGEHSRKWNSHKFHHVNPHMLPDGTWIAAVDGDDQPEDYEFCIHQKNDHDHDHDHDHTMTMTTTM